MINKPATLPARDPYKYNHAFVLVGNEVAHAGAGNAGMVNARMGGTEGGGRGGFGQGKASLGGALWGSCALNGG